MPTVFSGARFFSISREADTLDGMKRVAALFISFFAIALAPSLRADDPPPVAKPPAWTTQPTRTVDGGYIVYVGTGEDVTGERARFKAEGMAIQDLANECSFAPKGARPEDSYDQQQGRVFRAYAKVAVEFTDCEEARKAVDPEQIRKLANVQMSEELKRYQTMIDEPPPTTLAQAEDPAMNPTLANTSNPPQQQSGGYAYYGSPRVVVVNNPEGYVFVSQQVAWSKQIVILSPPAAYPPGAPQTTAFVSHVGVMTNQVHTYAVANPTIRSTAAPTWSAVRARYPAYRRPVNGYRPAAQPNRGGGRGGGWGGGGRRRREW